MSWIGGLIVVLTGGVFLLRKVVWSRLKSLEGLFFELLFWSFAWDTALSTILGLLRFLGGFDIIFGFSGLFRGFTSNGFLFELPSWGFPFLGGTLTDLSSIFCL